MANSITHAGLPYPVKGAKITLSPVWRNFEGNFADPATPAATRSLDVAAFAPCFNSLTVDTSGIGLITLTGDETDCIRLRVFLRDDDGTPAVWDSSAVLYPKSLPVSRDGEQTAIGGGSNWIQAAVFTEGIDYRGCIVKTTGGTGGGGGSGSRNNQARVIVDIIDDKAYVDPVWETNPDATTTFVVLITDADKSTMWTGADVDGFTPLESMRLLLAAAAGVVSGANDDPLTNKTIIISAVNDPDRARITSLVTPVGNRLIVTRDADL